VACEGRELVGYLDMIVQPRGWQGWVKHLVVHQAWRRRRVATRMLEVAEHWARGSRLNAITAVAQNKNDPAISLCINRGYVFRGFVDYYFDNGDVGLLYSLNFRP
jgi:GNAT superfamily N-acetyltransferase